METESKPVDNANVTIGLLNLLVNLEILANVTEQLDIARINKNANLRTLELKQVQATNDVRFYEAALANLMKY